MKLPSFIKEYKKEFALFLIDNKIFEAYIKNINNQKANYKYEVNFPIDPEYYVAIPFNWKSDGIDWESVDIWWILELERIKKNAVSK